MSQYLLSVHSVDGEARDSMTDEEMEQSWKQIQLLNEELKSAGAWLFPAGYTIPTPPPWCASPTARC